MPTARPDASEGAGQARIPAELETFFAIADKWRLSTEEQIALLGSPGRSTFFKWKKDGGALPVDTRERLSHMLGIWKSLRILFTEDHRGEAWVRANGTKLDEASIAAHNAMLGERIKPEESAAPQRAELGITDPNVRGAIALNDLDDWASLHAAVTGKRAASPA